MAGSIADQTALQGLLGKIRDLNLTLISIQRINLETKKKEDMIVDFPSEEDEKNRLISF